MDPRGTTTEKNEFHLRSLHHLAVQSIPPDATGEEKKPPTLPACVKAERNKNCANSIRSRLRNEMEDSIGLL